LLRTLAGGLQLLQECRVDRGVSGLHAAAAQAQLDADEDFHRLSSPAIVS
jgi:hypothetical protein